MTSLKDIKFENAKGETKTLADYDAKLFLIVNTASKCGLTPQYEGLQSLYERYHDKGLEILGFPANEFLGQEPGTDEEIQSFCEVNYSVSFPVNKKIIVKGEGQHPLYAQLIKERPEAVKNDNHTFENLLKEKGLLTGGPSDIKWNFEKFLVSKDGNVIERFFPDIAPGDEKITKKIEENL